MDKNYQLLAAAESQCKALLDKYTLTISHIMTRQDGEALDELLEVLSDYNDALGKYNFLQRVKAQGNQEKDENEN